ncbi:hypothetical protein [Staphylococcus sp. 17KM0847]|uniref:hypothetical protein n=1 Tax=Staphylococcus sp. 17KM0847 TaxID=2583989 RepID=UPI0015DCD36D|nr:hypothetical protein [Staphylococcus sp. 17KM0847]QLK85534.1 hypothetical protein FGL66_01845 [Staphylococcus sp. 17KM0847]
MQEAKVKALLTEFVVNGKINAEEAATLLDAISSLNDSQQQTTEHDSKNLGSETDEIRKAKASLVTKLIIDDKINFEEAATLLDAMLFNDSQQQTTAYDSKNLESETEVLFETSEVKKLVLDLLIEGKISKEEAVTLLDAISLNDSQQQTTAYDSKNLESETEASKVKKLVTDLLIDGKIKFEEAASLLGAMFFNDSQQQTTEHDSKNLGSETEASFETSIEDFVRDTFQSVTDILRKGVKAADDQWQRAKNKDDDHTTIDPFQHLEKTLQELSERLKAKNKE